MVTPIDYTSAFANLPSPNEAMMQGIKDGAGIQMLQQKQAAEQAARVQQEQMGADLAELSANPTVDGVIRVSLKHPQLSEQLKRSFDMLDPAEKQSKLEHMGLVYAATQSGKLDIAQDLLKRQAAAYRNSGNEKEAQAADTWVRLIGEHPESAKMYGGLIMSGVMGPEKYAETFGKLGAETRAVEQAPGALKKVNADGEKAESEAITKGVEAKYAEDVQKAAIAKQAADLKLTSAQTKSALASANNLGAETKKTLLEIKSLETSPGGVPPLKRFKLESDLRSEYTAQTKEFSSMKESYGRIKAAENTGAGDIALIYSYMKILDPTSVVREGEFATAQNSAGIPGAVVSAYNRALDGQRLTVQQRANFASQAKQFLTKAGVREKEVRKGIDTIATNYGLDKRNLYYNDADVSAPNEGAPAGADDIRAQADAILRGGK